MWPGPISIGRKENGNTKTTTGILTALLLAPLAALHAGESPESRLDSVPYVAGKEGYACYRCPTRAVSTQGTLLAFCEGRVNSHKDEDDMDVVLKRSMHGGRTWGPLQVLANDGRNPCKNPCPVVLPSGRILLVWLWNKWIPSEKDRTTREVLVMHSDDDGVTWSKPRSITHSVYQPDWKWYGTRPCHAIVKRSGPHKGRIVVPGRHNTKKTHMVSHVIYSDDNGEMWHIGGSVPRPQTTAYRPRILDAAGHRLVEQRHAGNLDGNPRPPEPAPAALRQPGRNGQLHGLGLRPSRPRHGPGSSSRSGPVLADGVAHRDAADDPVGPGDSRTD